MYCITVRHSGSAHAIELPSGATLGALQLAVAERTGVEPDRQKLVGLVRGRVPQDPAATLGALGVAATASVLLMGTPAAAAAELAAVAAAAAADTELVDDLDWDDATVAAMDGDAAAQTAALLQAARVSLAAHVAAAPPMVQLGAPRPGRKLLVLDLDHTLLDVSGGAAAAGSLGGVLRPGAHAFLADMYPHYDLAVWSQTSARTLESKVTTLRLLEHAQFRVWLLLDIRSMLSVTTFDAKRGQPRRHQVKPLELIWQRFPQFSARNTVHVDDLARNFALNPREGMRVAAFRRAEDDGSGSRVRPESPAWRPGDASPDRELLHLGMYLLRIASHSDFTELDHRRWRRAVRPR